MPGYDFLLQAMGGLMCVTGEPDGRPLKVGAAVVDLVCGLLATNGIQAALVGGRGPARPPRRGVADGLRADGAAQPGHGVGGRRRRAGRARQPPPEHRPVRDLRDRRPAVRDRGRQRAHVRAAVRGARARPSSPPTRASRPTRRASRTSRSSPPRRTRSCAPSPPTIGSTRLRAAEVPVGPINAVDEAFALADDLGIEPIDDSHGVPLITPAATNRRGAPGDPLSAAEARRARRRDPPLARGLSKLSQLLASRCPAVPRLAPMVRAWGLNALTGRARSSP